MVSNDKTRVYSIKASIDCPNCAMKVENSLKSYEDIEHVIFDFERELLTVRSSTSLDEIKKRAIKADDEIKFGEEYKEYTFNVSIDCPNCAQKVERSLESVYEIESAIFDFPNGILTVKTTLSKEEIIKLAQHADNEIEFLNESKKQESKDYTLMRVFSSLFFLALAFIVDIPLLAIISYLIAGYDVILKAFKNMRSGKFFDENFLMAIATIGALLIASYEEASGVMILYQIGEYFQRRATNRSRESIEKLFNLTPDYVYAI